MNKGDDKNLILQSQDLYAPYLSIKLIVDLKKICYNVIYWLKYRGEEMMYKIYKINYNNFSTNEIENLYLINKNITKKYNFLDTYKSIEDYKYKALYSSILV